MGRSNSNIFLDQEASKTGVVQRLLPLTMPGPITAHREWPVNGISIKPGNEPSQPRRTQRPGNTLKAWSNTGLGRDWRWALASCLCKDYIMTTASC